MTGPQVVIRSSSFRLGVGLAQEVVRRGPRVPDVLRRDLNRLYSLYRLALETVRSTLTARDAQTLCELLRGIQHDATTSWYILQEIRDHEAPAALVAKLEGFSRLERMALVDAIECFWLRYDADPTADPAILRVGVGLEDA